MDKFSGVTLGQAWSGGPPKGKLKRNKFLHASHHTIDQQNAAGGITCWSEYLAAKV